MNKRSRFYPRLTVDTADVPAVGQAGGVLLTETVRASGLDAAMARLNGLGTPSNVATIPGAPLTSSRCTPSPGMSRLIQPR